MTIRNVKIKDYGKKITYWTFGDADYQRAKSKALELDGEVIEIEDTENYARGYGVVVRKYSRKVAEIEVGTRKIYGTDFTVFNMVHREQMSGDKKPRWVVTLGLCNGVPDRAIECPTRKSALETMQGK